MNEIHKRRPTSATRMQNLSLEEVQVVLAESRVQIRTSLKGALAEAGLRNVHDVSQIATLKANLTQSIGPDVLICDTGLGGEGAICDVIRKVRCGELGKNPFLCIIAITWNPTTEEVDDIIDSGVDTLIAAPFAPQQIIDRIDALVHNRKPFLVTSDYIGPDRRLETDTRETKVPLMDAPNTLRLKAINEWNIAVARELIEEASGEVKFQQVERQAGDILHLTEQVIAQSTMPGPDMSRAHLDRLLVLLVALERHSEELEMSHLVDLCKSAAKLVRKMRKTFHGSGEKDLDLLKNLALAISGSAKPRDHNEESLAHDIAKTVNGLR